MATVARLDVKIGADLDDFSRQMSSMQSTLQGVGTKLKDVGKTMSLAVSLPLLAAGAAAINAASDVQEMQAKFDTVFSNVGGVVTDSLTTFADEVGRSRFELMGMAATLGDILKPMGFTEEAAGDISVELTKLATDLSSFNNMPMDEALARLRGTLVGAHENALAFGVVINENTLKAELNRMGADKLTGAQKEQAKVQARLNLLFQGTTDAQGDAAGTSESFANRMKDLQATLSDVAIEFGQHMIPLATSLVEKIRGLVSWVGDLSDENQRLVLIIGAVAVAIPPLAFAIGTIITAMSPLTVLIAAVIAAGAALVLNWDSIKEWATSNFPALSATIGTAFDMVVDLLVGLGSNFLLVWDNIVTIVSNALTAISGVFQFWFSIFTGDFSGAWDAVKNIFGAIWDSVVTIFRNQLQAIKNILPGFVKDWLGWSEDVAAATAPVVDATEEAGEKVTVMGHKFSDAAIPAANLTEGLNEVSDAAGTLTWEAVRVASKIEDDFAPALQDVADMSGNVKSEMGKVSDEMLRQTTAVGDLATESENSATRMTVAFSSFRARLTGPGGLLDAFGSGGLGGVLSNLKGTILDVATTAFPGIGTAISVASGLMKTFGVDTEDVMRAVGNTIKGIGEAIGGIFGRGKEAKERAEAIKSFTESVSASGLDISDLGAIGKSQIRELMTPFLSSGVASTEDLLGALGLTMEDLGLNISDSLGLMFNELSNNTGFANDLQRAAAALFDGRLSGIADEFGLSLDSVVMDWADLFGLSVDGIQAVVDRWNTPTDPVVGEDGSLSFNTDPEKTQPFDSGASQTIVVQLDGQTIAQATMPYWSQELEIYGTNR